MDHPQTGHLKIAPQGAVVVAIDDSDSSRAALAWAASYARTTGLPLHATHVFRYDFGAPEVWSPGLRGIPHTVSAPEYALTRTDVEQMFTEVVPAPGWRLTFLDGPVGQTLVGFAQDATVLVVGTREHRGLERLLVDSVSHYCLTHAGLPVVAVPPGPVAPIATLAPAAAGVPA